jgi:hypothetical protein
MVCTYSFRFKMRLCGGNSHTLPTLSFSYYRRKTHCYVAQSEINFPRISLNIHRLKNVSNKNSSSLLDLEFVLY